MRRARPLAGVRVAVTRPAEDALELAGLLEAAGAAPVLVPLTRILPPADDASLRRAVTDPDRYDWIVFTSARAVRATAAAMPARHVAAKLAAVGPATAAAVAAWSGRRPDVVSASTTGGGIVPAMQEHGSLQDAHVLWPRAERPRPELPQALRSAGAILEDPVAYRTAADPEAARRLADLAVAGDIDVITFTAPSAVDCFADVGVPTACVVAVIGPATAAAARARGLDVHVEPQQPIISALVSALARFHNRGTSQQP